MLAILWTLSVASLAVAALLRTLTIATLALLPVAARTALLSVAALLRTLSVAALLRTLSVAALLRTLTVAALLWTLTVAALLWALTVAALLWALSIAALLWALPVDGTVLAGCCRVIVVTRTVALLRTLAVAVSCVGVAAAVTWAVACCARTLLAAAKCGAESFRTESALIVACCANV